MYEARQVEVKEYWGEVWVSLNSISEILESIAEGKALGEIAADLFKGVEIDAGMLLMQNQVVNYDLISEPDNAFAVFKTAPQQRKVETMLGWWKDNQSEMKTVFSPTKEGCDNVPESRMVDYVFDSRIYTWDHKNDDAGTKLYELIDIKNIYMNKTLGSGQ